ncbi:MAG: septum formation family protein [Actinomycetes bacterium]
MSSRRINAGTVIGVVIAVALLAFLGWFWLLGGRAVGERVLNGTSVPEGQRTTSTTARAAPGELPASPDVELDADSYEVGDCVTWDEAKIRSDTKVVKCAEPHRIQIAGSRELDDYGSRREYPTENEWDAIIGRRCTPQVERALGGPLDPFGLWTVGALRPREDGWFQGDRLISCGIIRSNGSGSFALFTGRPNASQQYVPVPTGQCRALRPDGASSPVPCEQPHEIEIAGESLLGGSGAFPGDDAASDACEAVAERYVASNRSYSYDSWNYEERSWASGRRRFNCVVGVSGAVYGWGTRTGSLRG